MRTALKDGIFKEYRNAMIYLLDFVACITFEILMLPPLTGSLHMRHT